GQGLLGRVLRRSAPSARRRRARQTQLKGEALIRGLRQGKIATMALGELAGDGEAEPCAIGATRAGEGLEEALARPFRNAGAIVGDADQARVLEARQRHLDAP